MDDNKVVVTGIGPVTAIGIGKNRFLEQLKKGKSGIKEVSLFDTSAFKKHHFAGEIDDFEPLKFFSKSDQEFYGRATQFAIASTILALDDAGLSTRELNTQKNAIIFGSTFVETERAYQASLKIWENRLADLKKRELRQISASTISEGVGSALKINGMNLSIANACSAGNFSTAFGVDLIRKGRIDIAIVGGADALSQTAFNGFYRLRSMAPERCCPFDKNRKGMLVGEGAGSLILESKAAAIKRKARIYAEIIGYGISCDASDMVIPDREGVKRAMQQSLNDGHIDSQQVDYVCAHGTATKRNDMVESAAIREVFTSSYETLPVSSIKSMLGHPMGAASAIESITCILALDQGFIPPNINYETPDPDCGIPNIPAACIDKDIRIALNNSSAFGGNNCSILFSK